MRSRLLLNNIVQFAIPLFTLGGILLISLKQPGLGLVSNLIAQPFWLYETYWTWKRLGQWGMFFNTVSYSGIVLFGVINYFILT